jgi:acyl-coenzyme A synthetase/AMP-(fatty) acid ligase
MHGVGCRILDQAGRPVRDGEVGELVVTGGNVALGYLGDHRLTEQVFRRSHGGGGRELWTGDLFVRDADGFLFHCGRRDDLVKVSDQRLSLREVEDALRSVVGVIDALAWVEDGTLRADVVAEPGVADTASIRRRLRPSVRLPAMVPTEITLVRHLPTGPTGKPARPRPGMSQEPHEEPRPEQHKEPCPQLHVESR